MLLGDNTPTANSQRRDEGLETRIFHSDLSSQAGAYQNGTWVVGMAKAGGEVGHALVGGSVIVHTSGRVVTRAEATEDELILARTN